MNRVYNGIESIEPQPSFFVRISVLRSIKNAMMVGVFYLIGFGLLCLFMDSLADIIILCALYAWGAISLYVYWRIESWGAARYNCFGAALLLFSMCFKGISLVDTIFYGTRYEYWPITIRLDDSPLAYFLQGECISILGMLILVCTWRISVKHDIDHLSFTQTRIKKSNRLPWLVYGTALFTQFLLRMSNFDFGAYILLIAMFNTLGVASIYWISKPNHSKTSLLGVLLSVALALPLAYFSLGSGMKENVLFPFIPTVLIAWTVYGSVSVRILLITVGFAILALMQIYVGYVRQFNWQDGHVYSVSELSFYMATNLNAGGFWHGVDSMTARLNQAPSHAIAVALVDRDGFQPEEIFEPIPTSLIPRVFWPEKPILQPGSALTKRIQDSKLDVSQITSASAAGFFPELYLGGGYIAVILGAILYGFLAGKLQLFAIYRLPRFGVLACNFTMIYQAIRFDELHVVYAYTGIILSYILLISIIKSLSFFDMAIRR